MSLFHCNFFAKSVGTCVNVTVLLPLTGKSGDSGAAFEEIYSVAKPYKTLYLLHGMHGDETSWIRGTNLERYAAEKGIAVVMPAAQNSFYANMKNGLHYFTLLTEELPNFVRAAFPLSDKREDTYIAGLSMGGYGACRAALARPDLYAAAASLSGAVDIEAVDTASSRTPEERAMFDSVFGSPEDYHHDLADLFELSERCLASAKTLPALYLACGTDDELCYEMNDKLKTHLEKIAFPFTYEEGPGRHEWDFWDAYIRRVLEWLPL